MDLKAISTEFQAREHIFRHLEGEALFILNAALQSTDIKFHSITSRVKDLDSFVDKCQRKNYENPIEEIHDIVGLRVVCLFLSDIDRIGEIIRSSFSVLSEDNRIEGADASSFGYMSFHFTTTMKEEYSGPRYDSIGKLPFEIQVRTIAMDAWANVSHHLSYKSDKDVPSDLRRDFYALSGLFYVADKHFEIFYGASQRSQEEMTELFEEASSQEKAELELNLDSLTAYLNNRFPDRGHSPAKTVSVLVSELREAGYRTIGDVAQLLDRAQDAFLLYERERPPREGVRFLDVGVVRISAEIVSDDFIRSSTFRKNLGAGMDNSVAKAIAGYQKYRDLLPD